MIGDRSYKVHLDRLQPDPRVLKGEAGLASQIHAQRTPAFAGKPIDREALFWEHEGNRGGPRAGRSRLVAVRYKLWHLFDLDADRTERNDLVLRHPERITALSARWDDWARRSKVLSFSLRAEWRGRQPLT